MRTYLNNSTLLKKSLLYIVVISATILFIVEFNRHIESIKQYKLVFNFPDIIIASVLLFSSYLLATYSFKYYLDFHLKKKLSFVESITMFNTSRLANYIPGMVWGYGIQLLWLEKHGASKLLPA